MSTDSPPGSSRPRAGGEFTWPPTSEELDSIEVIPLDGSPSATTAPATFAASTTSVAPATLAAPPPPVAPATLVVPTAAAVVAKTTTTTDTPVIARRHRLPLARLPLARLPLPGREDFAYIGVTFASALAITVAAMLQLSDSRSASQTAEPPAAIASAATSPAATAPAEAAASPVANVALLQLLEREDADDVARTRTDAPLPATALPTTALTMTAPMTAAPMQTAPAMASSVTGLSNAASSPTAPARTVDARAGRESRVAARSQPAPARRATYARRSAPNVALRERRDSERAHDRIPDRARTRNRGSIAAATPVAMPVASPPLRLPESYVQPRLVSQGTGRHRGQVVLAVQVRPNGRVGDIEVLSKGDDRGYDDLERAAVSAVKRWRYRPALRDGVPTPARVKVVVNFS